MHFFFLESCGTWDLITPISFLTLALHSTAECLLQQVYNFKVFGYKYLVNTQLQQALLENPTCPIVSDGVSCGGEVPVRRWKESNHVSWARMSVGPSEMSSNGSAHSHSVCLWPKPPLCPFYLSSKLGFPQSFDVWAVLLISKHNHLWVFRPMYKVKTHFKWQLFSIGRWFSMLAAH